MTDPHATPTVVRKVVVVFDICSSTAILEDLIRTENQIRWQTLLGYMKRHLWSLGAGSRFEMYKFMGDGWILLFPDASISGERFLEVLTSISVQYQRLFQEHVAEVLNAMPTSVGVTFGVDEGSLVQIIMNRKTEYVGRALNVAARLQSAIKALGETPAGTALVSSNAFGRLRFDAPSQLIECALANVAGGEHYRVRKLRIAHEAA